jgi:Ala-tRNA(Pro) deacylase
MMCLERLEAYLRREQVPFRVHLHSAAFTAQGVAEHEHLAGQLMAKVVVVVCDGELVLLALPTSRRVDLARVSALFDAREVRLATEGELAVAFPDCEIGAMPPFGNLYGLPVYVDRELEGDHEIFFQAGTHTVAFSLAYADFQRLVAPTVADFTCTRQRPTAPPEELVRETGGW